MRLWIPVLLALYSPSAWACAVCGGGGQNRQAFVDTMVFLSAMPLMMLGLFGVAIWWLAKKANESDVTSDATTQTTAASPPQ